MPKLIENIEVDGDVLRVDVYVYQRITEIVSYLENEYHYLEDDDSRANTIKTMMSALEQISEDLTLFNNP